jgi:hydroxypyruvate reductase
MKAALNAVNGELAVRQTLRQEGNQLWVGETAYPLHPEGQLFVLAVGKAALAMARGAKASLGERLSKGLIITKFQPQNEPADFPVLLGDHPLPKGRSLRAARAVERFLKLLSPKDTLICLISGGASALLTSPRPPLRLQDLKKTTRLLLRCGANIHELNTIRKHLERFKGGGIVQTVHAGQVISLIISDVIGDSIEVIGSGMTAPDASTFQDALQIIEQYDLLPSLPTRVREYLLEGSQGYHPETLKPEASLFEKVANHIIASNRHACEAAHHYLQKSGIETLHLTSHLQGEASQVGKVFAAFARQLCVSRSDSAHPICWIAGGETTVTVHGDGVGGRNSELALGAVSDMDGLKGALLITLATDGDDGFSAAAGAVVSGSTAQRARKLGLQPNDFLRRNDSFTFFNHLQDCIFTTPTQTNVNDMIFLFVS